MSAAGSTAPSLHHLALGAEDVDRVAAFYRDVLGLAELRRQEDPFGGLRSVWLRLADAVLMIERSGSPPRWVEDIGRGPFLLAFRVEASERAAWEARLEAAGAAIESRSEWTSYARDPEGNRIAVSHY